jgi:hypothetical protein
MFYWKTIHGEDIERFVLDVALVDATGTPLAQRVVEGASITRRRRSRFRSGPGAGRREASIPTPCGRSSSACGR